MSAGITYVCKECGHIVRIEIPAIDELRQELTRLRNELKRMREDSQGLEQLKSIFGGEH